MTTLSALPVELITKVLRFINGQKPDILNIALTSKQLNALATPFIYETVIFETEEDLKHLPAFAALVNRSPEHARMVKSFALLVAAEDTAAWPSRMEYEDQVASKIEELLPTHYLSQKWKRLLIRDSGPDPAVMNLFVPMVLPNLQRLLYYNLLFADELWQPFNELIDAACTEQLDVSEPPFWPNLQEVFIEGLMDKYPDSTKGLAAFARLPWLKRLNCSGLGDGDGGDMNSLVCDEGGGFDLLEPSTTDMESIIIQPKSKLKSPHMDRLLYAPKALRVFKYNVGHTWAWTDFKSRDLEASLRHQCHSLEEISITHNYYEFLEGFGSDGDRMEPVTFSDFTCLKILEISLPFVFGQEALQFDEGTLNGRIIGSPDPTENDLKSMSKRLIDMVPQSLEEVRFSQLGEIWAARFLNTALLEFLGWRSEKFTKLERIELHFYPDKVDECLPELQPSLKKAFGLEIKVKAFKGGRLGGEDVEEGWRIGRGQYELAGAGPGAMQIPT